MALSDRLQHAWDAFMNKDPTIVYKNIGPSFARRPDRKTPPIGNDKSIVNSVINRMATDAASINMEHVRLDSERRFNGSVDSGLNYCLNIEANIDQSGRALRQDIFQTMLEKGVVAIVPVKTTLNPRLSESYIIREIRIGEILEWYPKHIKVNLYNEERAKKEELILPKAQVGIVENPYYSVMNAPNSTARRLIHKLSLLDYIDEQSGSGKLDLIIQLPYVIKTEARKKQAEERAKDIQMQLASSEYGIAYTDGTEKITQLNRAVENTLPDRVKSLTDDLLSELGITREILNGTANETTMTNYYTRVIEPLLGAVVDEMSRKFLTKTARTQGQTVTFFRDPFRLVPISNLADVADKFTRNAIMSSNEFRQVIGRKPSDDPNADALINKNMPFDRQAPMMGNPPEDQFAKTEGPEEGIGSIPISEL